VRSPNPTSIAGASSGPATSSPCRRTTPPRGRSDSRLFTVPAEGELDVAIAIRRRDGFSIRLATCSARQSLGTTSKPAALISTTPASRARRSCANVAEITGSSPVVST
jgi:hypothetical protein